MYFSPIFFNRENEDRTYSVYDFHLQKVQEEASSGNIQSINHSYEWHRGLYVLPLPCSMSKSTYYVRQSKQKVENRMVVGELCYGTVMKDDDAEVR